MVALEKTLMYLRESSDDDWRVAQKLFADKEYGYALFFCHLALEKLLKAVVVATTAGPADYTHALLRLAELAGIPLNENQIADLKTITKFNIAGRYDDEKRRFRKEATRDYAQRYLKITRELLIWLKKDYLKK